ncbi:MAG: hypothetical protein V4687_04585 [Bacteroidota bacterium]
MLTFLQTIIQLLTTISQLLSTLTTMPALNVIPLKREEIWLESFDVRRQFKISERTLYRRRIEGDFEARKIHGKWFYLESSVKSHFE